MKKLISLMLVLCIVFSVTSSATGLLISPAPKPQTYVTVKTALPDGVSNQDKWQMMAQYADTGEPIALSYFYDGYIHATIPAADKDREIQAFVPENIQFSDYTDDTSIDFTNMQVLSGMGVIQGNNKGEAKPLSTITRGEAVAMVMRFMGLGTDDYEGAALPFTDVKESDWFYDVVGLAYQYGIVEGDSEITFSPKRAVTREEIIVMVANALHYADLASGKDALDTVYEDASDVSDWAKDSYNFLQPYGMTDSEWLENEEIKYYLKPQQPALRKEVAALLRNLQRSCQFYPSALAVEYGFDKEMPVVDGSTSTYPFTQAVYTKLFLNGRNHDMYPVKHSKSHASYERLINGEVDMLFAASYPASDLLELAKEKGVELELIPIAYDAMIFFTNADNPATNLTMEQISDIYVNDAYDNWSSLSGNDALLYPYCRNNDSGSHAMMEKHFLNGNEIHKTIREETTSTSMSNVLTDVIDAQTKDPEGYALGYSIFYYFRDMDMVYGTSTLLKLLSVDGIAPTDETIADGTYPLANYAYIVMRSDTPEDAPARKMAEFMLTEAGQECVAAAGYGKLKLN